jgi:hypothetical protein
MSQPFNLISTADSVLKHFSSAGLINKLRSPVFILASPRSGSNLLFEQLIKQEGIWSIGGESHGIFRAFPHLTAENLEFDSGCLNEQHADQHTSDILRACYLYLARDFQGRPYLEGDYRDKASSITLLEKTPRNALNIPFLLKVFPDAKFIYLHRDPRENIASIIEAWKLGLSTGRFVTFKDLPGWDRKAWCLVLPSKWREMKGKSLAEIACFQWMQCNQMIMNSLQQLDTRRWISTSYDTFLSNPEQTIDKLLRFSNIELAQLNTTEILQPSRTTITTPDPDKWKKYQHEILALLPKFQPVVNAINDLKN